MAEVALDFEDEAGRAACGVVGLPGEELVGERAHAGRRLAGADGPEDGDAGEEAAFGQGQPFRPGGLPSLDGMVELSHHERGGGVPRARGPGREDAAPGEVARGLGIEPQAPGARGHEQPPAGDDGGGHEKPPADEVVEDRVLEGDEVEEGVRAGRGERSGEDGPGEGRQAKGDGGDGAPGEKPAKRRLGIA